MPKAFSLVLIVGFCLHFSATPDTPPPPGSGRREPHIQEVIPM
ncbi:MULTISPECIES: hypothetical protein [unclassified Microcoleus]